MQKVKDFFKSCFIRPTKRETIIIWVAFLFLAFQSYRTFIHPLQPMLLRPLHTIGMIIICYLCNPITKKMKNPNGWKKYLMIIDYIVLASTPVMIWYYINNYERLNLRIMYLDPLTKMDLIMGVWIVLVVLEGIRRSLGPVLTIFISIFIAYGYLSKFFNTGSIFYYRGLTLSKGVDLFVMSTDGIYGSALGACASFIFWIMLFGAVFAECGGGRVLVDLGMKVGTKTKDSSGPAKAAVIASGLMGMVSGSATANVAGTGVITIPLMKKVGYTPEEAGAVEAMASTGGQIMPPIMGAGAFLMAEMLGISYFDICKAAILPSLAYYFSIFFVVHYIARRRAKSGEQKLVTLEIEPILPRLYLLSPVIVLIYMIIQGFTIQRSALFALGLTLILAIIGRKKDRVSIEAIVNCILDSTRRVAEIGIPIAGCGIIVGVVNMSGIASRLSKLIVALGANYLWVALIITAVGCMILGMALPTIAAYLTAYVLFIPTLTAVGITTLPANLFIFYFGIFAQITPPVCVASYTAAGIAGGSAWKTGWKGFFFCLGAFMSPFMFVYRPSILLLEGSTIGSILYAAACLFIGVFFVALGMAGFYKTEMSIVERLAFMLAGLLFIIPLSICDYIGLGLGIVLMVLQFIRGKKHKAAAAQA